MLGKKKKEEQKDSQENDLDKPQTLAELDAMAREKKDGDKVVLQDEDEERPSGDIDHEVTHHDEHTVDTNVRKVTGSQRKLQALVGLAVMLLIFGGAMFYTQLEDGAGGIGAGGDGQIVEDPEEVEGEGSDLLPRGTYAFAADPGSNTYTRYNLDDQSTGDIDVGASVTKSDASPAFQLSNDSLISATKTSSGIVVKVVEETKTLLADQISRVQEWILIPDGTRLFALVGNDLYSFDTSTEVGGLVAENFAPSGSERSRLSYARDGTVSMYAKADTSLTGSVYSLKTGEVEPVEKTVPRLGRVGGFQPNSVSPDGTSVLFIAEFSGNQTLQLLSLNSLVLRTVYVADPGNVPREFAWSQDSNNVLVYESGSSGIISNLKVGVLEKEALEERVSSATSLRWSPDKKYASYVGGGSLRGITIENKEVTELVSSVSADAITGWFQN